jgi:hypothetical protein
MFVGGEVRLDVPLDVVLDRIARLARSGVLLSSSRHAYDGECARLTRVGVEGLSKLVRVQVWPSVGRRPASAARSSRSSTPI